LVTLPYWVVLSNVVATVIGCAPVSGKIGS
jgi:hypothetical protein